MVLKPMYPTVETKQELTAGVWCGAPPHLLTLPQRADLTVRIGGAGGAHGLEPPPGPQQGGGQVLGE